MMSVVGCDELDVELSVGAMAMAVALAVAVEAFVVESAIEDVNTGLDVEMVGDIELLVEFVMLLVTRLGLDTKRLVVTVGCIV